MLKKVPLQEGPYELQINKLFSTEPVCSDSRNHGVHLLDVIELPNDPPILVQPLLRPFYKPPLQTFGEFVTFFAQICEVGFVVLDATNRISESRREYNSCTKITSLIGWFIYILAFYFGSNVTYGRDCTSENIMLDPSNMYPESFHPVKMSRSRDFRHRAKAYTRTQRPSRYLLIDFGLSRYYDPANGPPLDEPLRGGDKSAPEHQDDETLCNPFPADVYYLGNLVRGYFMQVRDSFCDRESILIFHGSEISRVRVYGTTRRRDGSR